MASSGHTMFYVMTGRKNRAVAHQTSDDIRYTPACRVIVFIALYAMGTDNLGRGRCGVSLRFE